MCLIIGNYLFKTGQLVHYETEVLGTEEKAYKDSLFKCVDKGNWKKMFYKKRIVILHLSASFRIWALQIYRLKVLGNRSQNSEAICGLLQNILFSSH